MQETRQLNPEGQAFLDEYFQRFPFLFWSFEEWEDVREERRRIESVGKSVQATLRVLLDLAEDQLSITINQAELAKRRGLSRRQVMRHLDILSEEIIEKRANTRRDLGTKHWGSQNMWQAENSYSWTIAVQRAAKEVIPSEH